MLLLFIRVFSATCNIFILSLIKVFHSANYNCFDYLCYSFLVLSVAISLMVFAIVCANFYFYCVLL